MYSLLLRASDSLILSLFFCNRANDSFFLSETSTIGGCFFVGLLFREHQRLIFVVVFDL